MTTTSKPSERIDLPPTATRPDSAAAGPRPGEPQARFSEGLDPEILQETKNQIRGLVQEISALVDAGSEPEAFYQGYLPRVVAALAAEGGALWLLNDRQQLEQKYQMQWSRTVMAREPRAAERHHRLLQNLLAAGEPAVVPPQSGDASAAGNPTDHLLLFGILQVDQKPVGMIEIFQRSGASPTTQRGYVRFIEQVSELGSRYLRNRRLDRLAEQQAVWQRQDHFVRAVHRSLALRPTLFALANEGRRVVECDRVSVGLRQGNRCEIQVVSGLDTLERRAEQLKTLSQLTTLVVRSGEPLWFDPTQTDCPPSLDKLVRRYVELAHVKSLAIVPLHPSARPRLGAEAVDGNPPVERARAPLGALVCEQLTDEPLGEKLRGRIAWIAAHGGDAVAAAREHSRIFLLPLWLALGDWRSRVAPGRVARWGLVLAAVAVGLASLWLWPASFTLAAKGVLVPQTRHEIFAPTDGTLDALFLPDDPDAIVEPEHVLARLSNNDLLVAIEDLEGQLQQWTTRHQNLTHSWSEQKNLIDKLQVERDLSEATAMLSALQRQLEIKRRELALLEIRAPVRGRIINWQLQQTLLRRPVKTGQSLMTVVAPDTEWLLELELPERRVAHFLRAAEHAETPLQVRFSLASLPGQELRGTIVEWDRRLEVHSDQGNCLRIRVAFDKQAVTEDMLKTGTRATAQIECGERSLGYVWFRELIETVQATWFMWF